MVVSVFRLQPLPPCHDPPAPVPLTPGASLHPAIQFPHRPSAQPLLPPTIHRSFYSQYLNVFIDWRFHDMDGMVAEDHRRNTGNTAHSYISCITDGGFHGRFRWEVHLQVWMLGMIGKRRKGKSNRGDNEKWKKGMCSTSSNPVGRRISIGNIGKPL